MSRSQLAQICQMPREFDFPRIAMPEQFHYVGPLRRASTEPIPFPWERLDGRPVVYASLGTLQNSREPLFRCFAEACRGLGVQLVISHGGGLSPEQAAGLPGDPLVVAYAPQAELLARSSLTIVHAGLNTVLDSLANGVPIVAVPINYEQPAIARRIEFTGSGRAIPLARLNTAALRQTVSDVLRQSCYRQAARRLGDAIGKAGEASSALPTSSKLLWQIPGADRGSSVSPMPPAGSIYRRIDSMTSAARWRPPAILDASHRRSASRRYVLAFSRSRRNADRSRSDVNLAGGITMPAPVLAVLAAIAG